MSFCFKASCNYCVILFLLKAIRYLQSLLVYKHTNEKNPQCNSQQIIVIHILAFAPSAKAISFFLSTQLMLEPLQQHLFTPPAPWEQHGCSAPWRLQCGVSSQKTGGTFTSSSGFHARKLRVALRGLMSFQSPMHLTNSPPECQRRAEELQRWTPTPILPCPGLAGPCRGAALGPSGRCSQSGAQP